MPNIEEKCITLFFDKKIKPRFSVAVFSFKLNCHEFSYSEANKNMQAITIATTEYSPVLIDERFTPKSKTEKANAVQRSHGFKAGKLIISVFVLSAVFINSVPDNVYFGSFSVSIRRKLTVRIRHFKNPKPDVRTDGQ